NADIAFQDSLPAGRTVPKHRAWNGLFHEQLIHLRRVVHEVGGRSGSQAGDSGRHLLGLHPERLLSRGHAPCWRIHQQEDRRPAVSVPGLDPVLGVHLHILLVRLLVLLVSDHLWMRHWDRGRNRLQPPPVLRLQTLPQQHRARLERGHLWTGPEPHPVLPAANLDRQPRQQDARPHGGKRTLLFGRGDPGEGAQDVRGDGPVHHVIVHHLHPHHVRARGGLRQRRPGPRGGLVWEAPAGRAANGVEAPPAGMRLRAGGRQARRGLSEDELRVRVRVHEHHSHRGAALADVRPGGHPTGAGARRGRAGAGTGAAAARRKAGDPEGLRPGHETPREPRRDRQRGAGRGVQTAPGKTVLAGLLADLPLFAVRPLHCIMVEEHWNHPLEHLG
ncbi:hypothetical protein OIY81_2773, partial [Cryptosporidium canis]